MSKKTTGKIILTLAAMLAAGSVTAAGKTAAVQFNSSLFQRISAEKLLYCETDYDYIEENNHS